MYNPRFYLSFLFIASCILMIGCSVTSPEAQDNNLDSTQSIGASPYSTEEAIISTATVTTTPTALAAIKETPTMGVMVENTQQSPLAATMTPLPTVTSLPSPTYTPEPSPTVMTVECENKEALPAKITPTEIDMRRGRIAVDEPYLYLVGQRYVGVFDISVPKSPEFLGFWEFPDLSNISAIEAKNGIVYISSNITLQALNASSQCRFETIFRGEMPFQIYKLVREDDRLYVGGVSENDEMRQVAILSDGEFPQQELGRVDLGEKSATWSVFEETLYGLSGNRLTFTVVSNPEMLHTQTINLGLDPEALLFSPAEFLHDTLYVLLQGRGGYRLTIVKNLKRETPTIIQDTIGYHFGTSDVFQVQDNYIFVGSNSCDVSCTSSVTIADARSGQELSGLGLQPHHPIYHYQEIRQDLIYAFSNDSLLVVDMSNMAAPKIIDQVLFIQ